MPSPSLKCMLTEKAAWPWGKHFNTFFFCKRYTNHVKLQSPITIDFFL